MDITHHIDAMVFIMVRGGADRCGRIQLIQKSSIHHGEY